MATDATLTQSQKNAVFQLIEKLECSPSDFEWTEQKHEWTLYPSGTRVHRVSVLTHRATGYYCLFGDWVLVVCPGTKTKVEATHHKHHWNERMRICAEWLLDVRHEAEAPDLMKEFIEYSQLHFSEAHGVAEQLGNYINRQIQRLRSSLSNDPELAIGTAKEFLETLCRTILEDRKIPASKDEDLPGLVKLTIRNLKTVPDGLNAPNIDKAIAALIGNLGSTAHQLAEIRNAFGTGHGKAAGQIGLEQRHAHLAVGAAITLAVFLFRCHEAG